MAINQIASGGYDKILCMSDLNHDPRLLQSANLPDTISSVKWTQFLGPCVSVTTEEGGMYLYDSKTDFAKPNISISTAKSELFTHEIYNGYNMMLGYGDGSIAHYDIRKTDHMLHSSQDPFIIDGIGNIAYNSNSMSFAVSGFTDFSIWKQDPQTQKAQIWSHSTSTPNVLDNVSGFATNAIYLNDTSVIVSNTEGYLLIY